jgi:hypothetical protein
MEKQEGNFKKLKTTEVKMQCINNLLNTPKAVLRGKFTAISIYNKKLERFRINNLVMQLM